MLHLAQVEKIASSDQMALRLIARQRSEYSWAVILEPDVIYLDTLIEFGEGTLVLVTVSETRQVTQVDSASPWLIDIMQTFLKSGITPAFLQAESDRAEQWRQTLTLQSQDLDRRALELEARREQIEQLEETLKREKKQMEALAVQYKQMEALAVQYKEQTQELDRRTSEVETLRQQVDQLQTALQWEQKQVAELLAHRETNSKPSL